MKNKWYISALIITLAILGIGLEKGTVANQEIVIQFADTELTLDQAQEAISLIEVQLKDLDVDDIRIASFENGTLKIKYYSDIEVSEIKKIFSEAVVSTQHPLFTDKEGDNLPYDNESKNYLLDIYQIQDSSDLLDAQGAIGESKTGTTRPITFNTYASFLKHNLEIEDRSLRIAYQAHRNPAIAIKNSSYKIPEVRAGPNS